MGPVTAATGAGGNMGKETKLVPQSRSPVSLTQKGQKGRKSQIPERFKDSFNGVLSRFGDTNSRFENPPPPESLCVRVVVPLLPIAKLVDEGCGVVSGLNSREKSTRGSDGGGKSNAYPKQCNKAGNKGEGDKFSAFRKGPWKENSQSKICGGSSETLKLTQGKRQSALNSYSLLDMINATPRSAFTEANSEDAAVEKECFQGTHFQENVSWLDFDKLLEPNALLPNFVFSNPSCAREEIPCPVSGSPSAAAPAPSTMASSGDKCREHFDMKTKHCAKKKRVVKITAWKSKSGSIVCKRTGSAPALENVFTNKIAGYPVVDSQLLLQQSELARPGNHLHGYPSYDAAESLDADWNYIEHLWNQWIYARE